MKLFTLRRFLVVCAIGVVCAAAVWLDRREQRVHEGPVVLDDAFLRRLDTEDPRTTRDPAIRVLRIWYKAEYKKGVMGISSAELRNGNWLVRIVSLDKDSVEVVLNHSGSDDFNLTIPCTRHRRKDWRIFSADWWRSEVFHPPYWDYGRAPHSRAGSK